MQQVTFKKIWGEAYAVFDRSRKASWVDLLLLVSLGGLLFAIISMARDATGTAQHVVEIDLSPWALPRYTFYSLMRGLIAYGLSLGFTLVYGYWAAKDQVAERVLVPLLDILQSIPVLGFMPAVLLALVAAFPNSNVGLELTCILMIFTGQAWNMTFSFYHSLRSVPEDQREVATVYRFTWWQRFRWVELPFSTMGLVWNSMMSMAGGWFYLITCEAPEIGAREFRLPGIGSYMSVASKEERVGLQILAIAAMMGMIVLLDQLLWRPVVVWAQKFRVEEGGNQEKMTSWFLDWLRRSRFLGTVKRLLGRIKVERSAKQQAAKVHFDPTRSSPWVGRLTLGLFILLLAALGYGAWRLLELILEVTPKQWLDMVVASLCTMGRVLAAVTLGTLWALPAGLAIGLSPRLARICQPIVQVLASFPAPMLFPLMIAGFEMAGISLNWYSIILILVGTQWYVLFNVIAGTMAIPADLKEAATSYRIRGWQRFRVLYFPAVFPYLLTGLVTAAGGAWNASIVAEIVKYNKNELSATGLGAMIAKAAAAEDGLPLLAASIVVMSTIVVAFNRTVWKRCYRLAEERYSLNK